MTRKRDLLMLSGAALLTMSVAAMPDEAVPRNTIPTHPKSQNADPSEVESLRKTVKSQEVAIRALRAEVARLGGEVDRLGSVQRDAAERADRLAADLGRSQAHEEELRSQVAALSEEVSRPKAGRKDLVGTWRVVTAEEDGEPQPRAVVRLTFGPKVVTFHYPGPGGERTYPYKLDPVEDPREIDIFSGGIRPTRGIYTTDGPRLTLCIDRGVNTRPTEFRNRSGSRTLLLVLEREGNAP